MKVNFILNGKPVEATVAPDTALIEVLRDMGCFSVKSGCDTGMCGACTIHVNGKPALSCVMLAARAEGCEVLTLEGVREDALRIGQHLVSEGVEQCGYCSPGTIMSILYLEACVEDPTDDDILYYLNGNLCRCSGYAGQLRAIRQYLEAKKNELRA